MAKRRSADRRRVIPGEPVKWRVRGDRREGLDGRGNVIRILPARTTTEELPHVVMHRRKHLSDRQKDAADRLRREFLDATAVGARSVDWERVEQAMSGPRPSKALRWAHRLRPAREPRVRRGEEPEGNRATAAAEAAERFAAALQLGVGVAASPVVCWVVCEGRTCAEYAEVRNHARERGDPDRLTVGGVAQILKTALNSLADHYDAERGDAGVRRGLDFLQSIR